jgi:threonyl-tRNA synthetase
MKYSTLEIMSRLEQLGWVKSFPIAHKGQYYFTPRGTHVFNKMVNFLKSWVQKELNSLEIRTPLLYDWLDSSIQAESSTFSERVFQSNVDHKIGVWRPGGDFGVMSFMSKRALSQNHLPIALFELATSFRKAQSRELSGLLKARCFTLLDHHTFAENSEKAWDAYCSIIFAQAKLADFFKLSYCLHLQIERHFLIQQAERIQTLKNQLNIKIIVLEQQTNYWRIQHHFIDTDDGIAFSDGQYDEINAKNYAIQYTESDGKSKQFPIICHGSFDSVERWIFKWVNHAMRSDGYAFPLWLSPLHIRLIPYDEKTFQLAQIIHTTARDKGIMVEIDMRKKSVEQRKKLAFSDWVPFIVCFDAFKADALLITRLNGESYSQSLATLLEEIHGLLMLAHDSFLPTLDDVIRKPILK